MSWIVQSLLNNRDKIKASQDINSDQYNDLLAIEKAIDYLRAIGRITDEESQILLYVSSGGYDIKSNGTLDRERHSISAHYSRICQRIAYYLGGYFTDEGYIMYMKSKYGLDKQQVDTLIKYINSEYKHKIRRNPING